MSGVQRREVVFARPDNDNGCDEPFALDPETEARFIKALADVVLQSILRRRKQQNEAK